MENSITNLVLDILHPSCELSFLFIPIDNNILQKKSRTNLRKITACVLEIFTGEKINCLKHLTL